MSLYLLCFLVLAVSLFTGCASTNKFTPYLSDENSTSVVKIPLNIQDGQFSGDLFWTSDQDLYLITPIIDMYPDSMITYSGREMLDPQRSAHFAGIKNKAKIYHVSMEDPSAASKLKSGEEKENVVKDILKQFSPIVSLDATKIDTTEAIANYKKNKSASFSNYEFIDRHFGQEYVNPQDKEVYYLVITVHGYYWFDIKWRAIYAPGLLGDIHKKGIRWFTSGMNIAVYRNEADYSQGSAPLKEFNTDMNRAGNYVMNAAACKGSYAPLEIPVENAFGSTVPWIEYFRGRIFPRVSFTPDMNHAVINSVVTRSVRTSSTIIISPSRSHRIGRRLLTLLTLYREV